MDAIRQFIDVKDNTFQVILPDSFTASRVEIIVFPSEDEYNIPEWQKNIVSERIEAVKQNPDLLLDEDQFWTDLDNES